MRFRVLGFYKVYFVFSVFNCLIVLWEIEIVSDIFIIEGLNVERGYL